MNSKQSEVPVENPLVKRLLGQTNPTQSSEPVAWIIDVAEQENQYFVGDIEDAMDDLTNHNAVATPLFTHPSPLTAELKAELLEALTIGEVAQMHVRTSMFAVADIHDARLNKIRAAIALIEKVKP